MALCHKILVPGNPLHHDYSFILYLPIMRQSSMEFAHLLLYDQAFSHQSPILRANLQAFEKDRKSTRLNSSHVSISYAVFCLKKKNNIVENTEVSGSNE